MIIHVTEEDIKEGLAGSKTQCAIALALKRQTKRDYAAVHNGVLAFWIGRYFVSFPQPESVKDFIESFDSSREQVRAMAKPFSFEMDDV